MGEELKVATGIKRRTVIIGGAVGAATLAGGGLLLRTLKPMEEPHAPLAGSATPLPRPSYTDWHDVYRERWTWDKVVRSSHFVNCWYQAHCAWNVYVKDGLVWREEQVAEYPQTNAEVPDPNPRGCQKGACFSERMYDPARVRYPMKRVGERGSGRWRRVSWDEALSDIADKMLDTITEHGSDRIVWDIGPLYTEGTMSAAHQRHIMLLDSTSLDQNSEIGDAHRGVAETFGKIGFERSADDYMYSDLILIWGSNPLYTQIPNAHFLTEARYKGAQIVCIAPDFSASSIHSDLHVPVEPGCDAALALGIASVLVDEGAVDLDFIAEQTDLPLLVREDTRRYLRSSDLRKGGSDEQLYFHDEQQGISPVPRRSLALGSLTPTVDGRFEVELASGETVGVRTVYSLLREQLADYTPEKASALCGTPPATIRRLARMLARARAAAMVTSSNMDKYYHGNLMERSQALVFALTGNYGKKGSGFVGFPWLDHDALEKFIRSMFGVGDMLNPTAIKTVGGMLAKQLKWKAQGYTDEMIVYEQGRSVISEGRMACGALFWYVHGGLLEASEKLQEWDPYLERPVREVLEESLSKGWQEVWPRPGNDPKMLFVLGANPLRRIRSYPLVLEHLWPKLDLIVTLDWRMTSTTVASDYVLPAAAWYERDEHKWVTPLMPFIHSGEKATSYYEAKSDWEIISRLTEKVDERARARGIESFVDRRGDELPLHNLYAKFSSNGEYGHTDDEKVCAYLIDNASNLGDLTWPELKKKGFARFEKIGHGAVAIGNATEIEPGETITPLTKHVFDKMPYPTLSRRIQFYIDQELYLEMGEQLPIHKAPPLAGGNYPLILTGGHTRWSIHSAWRDDSLMLQQQRGEPVVFMSVVDAAERRIRDGGMVRIFNDLDEFEIMAKVSRSMRKGQLTIYHAWENFQFKNGKGFQNLIPTPLNPVELAGGQFHLRPMVIALQPGHTDRDTRVEVEATSDGASR
ncbi:MAG: molybdopterin-dependent oxidoreductase [Deltaproteobacteria bacterium]|nr:molybdopterin-dependent oxidoreductase [Deltaproteobacteria bacterium]MBW2360728.1 molybdopterin-dependent oxidoreductase [Deltaproteobacteria bacterium]